MKVRDRRTQQTGPLDLFFMNSKGELLPPNRNGCRKTFCRTSSLLFAWGGGASSSLSVPSSVCPSIPAALDCSPDCKHKRAISPQPGGSGVCCWVGVWLTAAAPKRSRHDEREDSCSFLMGGSQKKMLIFVISTSGWDLRQQQKPPAWWLLTTSSCRVWSRLCLSLIFIRKHQTNPLSLAEGILLHLQHFIFWHNWRKKTNEVHVCVWTDYRRTDPVLFMKPRLTTEHHFSLRPGVSVYLFSLTFWLHLLQKNTRN